MAAKSNSIFKITQLAKDLGLKPKELTEKLEALGIGVKNTEIAAYSPFSSFSSSSVSPCHSSMSCSCLFVVSWSLSVSERIFS